MNAALLAKLIEAGTPAELVAEVAVELGRAEATREAVEKKREYDREYQRERRQNRTTSHDTNDVADPSPFEVSPHTPLPKTPNQCSPLNPPKSRAKRAVSVQAPEWLPVEPWIAFVAMREAMAVRGKVIWSEAAAKGVIAKIDQLRGEGHCPAKLLSKAVVSSWRTVFADDDTKAPRGAGQSTLSATQLRERAEWYLQHGQPDSAEECRRKAIALERQAA